MKSKPLLCPWVKTAPIGAFREHPAQMRTIYEVDDMAELTLQVYPKGHNNMKTA